MSRRSLVLAFLALFILPLSVYAAVTLKYFRIGEVADNSIQVEWETATELDTASFILSRAESEDGPYTELETFPAEGDAVTGEYYEYIDTNVQPGVTYWYKLEEQETNGNKKPAANVVSANPGQGQPTAAPTEEGSETPAPEESVTPASETATPASGTAESPTQEPAATPAPAATEPPVQESPATPAPGVKEQPAATEAPAPTNTSPAGAVATTAPPPPSQGGGSGSSSDGNMLLLIIGIVALVAAVIIGIVAFRMKGGS
jgi:hypothetical protein